MDSQTTGRIGRTMHYPWKGRTVWKRALLALGLLLTTACVKSSPVLDLTTLDSGHDHSAIASYHLHEAAVLRLKGQNAAAQARQYERLFGSDSDWVAGARLLAQFYEETAQEQERMAETHFGIARHKSALPLMNQP